MIIISDTTAISNLLQLGELALLNKLYGEVWIPDAVFKELKVLDAMGIPAQSVLQEYGILVKRVSPSTKLDELLVDLDRGEAEAIWLAIDKKADLLFMDETQGRAKAKALSLKVVGTLGILLQAKKEGLVEGLEEKMNQLRSIGFWISDALFQKVLDIESRMT